MTDTVKAIEPEARNEAIAEAEDILEGVDEGNTYCLEVGPLARWIFAYEAALRQRDERIAELEAGLNGVLSKFDLAVKKGDRVLTTALDALYEIEMAIRSLLNKDNAND